VAQIRDDINIQILTSRFGVTDDNLYKILPGDSLSKIAKKCNTTVELLKKSNGLSSDKIFAGDSLKVVKGVFSIHVDKSANTLELLLDGEHVKTYRVATGKDNCSPVGEFTIKNKLVDPTWFHAGVAVPPNSPENILGTRWMGFDISGYGIHGTTLPESIGTQSTSGCMRMHNVEVEELYALVPVGTKVTIVD
jgi:hypothetical protein